MKRLVVLVVALAMLGLVLGDRGSAKLLTDRHSWWSWRSLPRG